MTERRKEGSSLLEVGGWNDAVMSRRQREGTMQLAWKLEGGMPSDTGEGRCLLSSQSLFQML